MNYQRLSYDLTERDPVPGGLQPPKIVQTHDMKKGDVSNVYNLTLCNHVGTHMDGPNHFSKDKPPLHKAPIETFVFDKPLLLDLPKGDSEMISAEDLAPHAEPIAGCDLLLLRTGFGKIRADDTRRYAQDNPGITTSAARFLVDRGSNLRALGIDTLSFAAMQHLDEGLPVHTILLDTNPRDLFLIEDMDLDHDLAALERVIALPLYCERLDSAPCTVLAILS